MIRSAEHRAGIDGSSVINVRTNSYISAGNFALSAQPKVRCRLRERHARRSGVEHDQDDRHLAGHASMDAVNRFGKGLARDEVPSESIPSLKGELAGEDIARVRHGMGVPFQRRVRRDGNPEHTDQRLAVGVPCIGRCVPRSGTLNERLDLDRRLKGTLGVCATRGQRS